MRTIDYPNLANKSFRIADFRSQATRISMLSLLDHQVASQMRRRSFDTAARMGKGARPPSLPISMLNQPTVRGGCLRSIIKRHKLGY